jgi:hypothetical protein
MEMEHHSFVQRIGLAVLCVSLLVTTILFAIRVEYTSPVHEFIAAAQIGLGCLSAWILGASAMIGGPLDCQKLAVAGSLLITPWIMFALLAGFGRPDQSSAAENLSRYIVLFVSSMAVGGGLIVLREALSEQGERLYSTLGFAAIVMASPIYLIWASIALDYSSWRLHAGNQHVSPEMLSLAIWSEILLFAGGLLTYLSTAAFAASLRRARWLGRSAAFAMIALSLVAALLLALRGLSFPDPKVALTSWYTTAGWVVGIPAIPWMIPCVMGIVLLWRAGSRQNQ